MLPLRTTLLVNAISSGATGLLLVLLDSTVAGLFGVSNTTPFIAAGIFLIFFALFVGITARKSPVNTGSVKWISTMDILWVVASLVVVLVYSSMLSAWGIILIVAVAGWVALMAFLQIRGSAAINPS